MNIVVVGAGVIGKERIKAVEALGEKIVAIVDPLYSEISLAEARTFNPDWVFVCTPHDTAVEVVKEVSKWNVNILVEKPYLGDIPVNVGLNYRFYRGVNKLLLDVSEGVFGDLISVNMILGLSDPPDTDKTWRLDPKRAGDCAMLDPGIHLVDLAMLISNNTLQYINGISVSKFWNTGFIEEEHIIATDDNYVVYNIQASKVRWRSTFRVGVNGTDGYGIVEGRNRHYGNQTYRRGKRWGWMSGVSQRDSEEEVVNYDGEDSFLEETRAVLYGTNSRIQPATYEDNNKCLNFIKCV